MASERCHPRGFFDLLLKQEGNLVSSSPSSSLVEEIEEEDEKREEIVAERICRVSGY